jgi:hypothetical protein
MNPNSFALNNFITQGYITCFKKYRLPEGTCHGMAGENQDHTRRKIVSVFIPGQFDVRYSTAKRFALSLILMGPG